MLEFSDAVEQWLDVLDAGGLSESSIRQYRSHLRTLLTATRGLWPGYPDLIRWQRAHKHQAAATRHHKAKSVRHFFAWAHDEELIATNPARKLAVPRRDRMLPRMLEEAEFEILRTGRLRTHYRRGERFLAKRDTALVQLMIFTGLRRAEVSALNVGDVDTGSRVLLVRQGKGRRDRAVPLPPELDLVPLIRGRDRGEPLFVSRYAGRRLGPRGVGSLFEKKVTEALGRPVHPHMLRHAYATYLCRQGTPLPHIQRLLGHASLATTQMYLDVTAADLRDSVARAFSGVRSG